MPARPARQLLCAASVLMTAMSGTAGAGTAAAAPGGSGLRAPAPVKAAETAGVYLGTTGSAPGGPAATWRGRVGLELSPVAPWAAPAQGLQVHGLRLLGDYYFSPGSGFRATGGVLRGGAGQPWMLAGASGVGPVGLGLHTHLAGPAAPAGGLNPQRLLERGTLPYLGAGYSLDLPETWGGNWSFSADIGLVALKPGSAVKLGGVLGGSQSLDDAVRELRLRPVLQLGVNYSF